jgi:hypothetical protein
MRRENAMLKLGTRVEYANQAGRIVGRTIELQPKYDVMLANGTIRANLREGDLVISEQTAKSIEHEQTVEEVWNADTDRRR